MKIFMNKEQARELLRGIKLCRQYALPNTPDMEIIEKRIWEKLTLQSNRKKPWIQ